VVPDGTAAGDAFMVNGADAGVVTSVSGTNAIVRVSRDALDATAPLSQ
jgi:hypothetical protein